MSSKGKRRSNSSKPALSSEAQQTEGTVPSAAESSPEPVPAQDTMDQSSKSMVSTSSSSDQSSPSNAAAPVSKPAPTTGTPEESTPTLQSAPVGAATMHAQPIPPASEPTQYRAIGLIRAKYVPSAKQFSRGQLVTDDECTFNAVLLGRVMSLVKKHLDPESNHLWVVYPRTREKTCDLHVQIVGVWEPETLDRTAEALEDSAIAPEGDIDAETQAKQGSNPEPSSQQAADEATAPRAPMPPKPPATPSAKIIDYHPLEAPTAPEDGYFSIRGEIVNLAQNPDRVTVKIQQSPRKGEDEGRSFRIMLMGSLEGRTLGHFWELNVRRQGMDLVIEDGQRICVVQPRKPPKGKVPPSKGSHTKSAPRRSGPSPRPTPRPVPSSSSEGSPKKISLEPQNNAAQADATESED